jgi:ferric-dicitrate binding protein FerR (iron transport regulator)
MRVPPDPSTSHSGETAGLDPTLIDRYLTEPGDHDVRVMVERWIAANPSRREWLAQMKRERERDAVMAESDARAWFEAVVRRSGEKESRPRRRSAWQYASHAWIAVASVAVAAVVAVGLTRRMDTPQLDETRTYTTHAGQTATLTLSDGTRVTLAPRTVFRLIHFGSSSRAVSIDGEAYFVVARTNGAPFLVRSGTVTTRVLGTEFLVRSRGDARGTHVAVADGKVSVQALALRDSGLTLTAGYVGDVTDSTVHVTTVDDALLEAGRRNGEFVFRDMPVQKILETLAHWYGYQFRCSDPSVTQQSITVAMSTRSSAAALAALEQVLNVNVSVVGDTVTMTPHPVRPPRGSSRVRTYDTWMPNKEVGR